MAHRRAVRRRPLLCENLEERCLLSTITVTSLADNTDADGEVTLREAILAANSDTSVDGSVAGNGADKIEFAPSISDGRIFLTNGELDITESVVIKGPSKKVTIDARGSDRILNVSADAENVVLNRLRFRNAVDTAIVSESPKLKLLRSELIDNVGDNGGGVNSRGRLILNQSRFLRNAATNGGGAYVRGRATITDTVFLSNRATNRGGGIDIQATTTVEGSRFERNQAEVGGAIQFQAFSGDLELADSVISGNTATTGSALYGKDADYFATNITSAVIEKNVARDGSTVHIYGFDCGYDFEMTSSRITGSTIANNTGDGVEIQGCYSDLSVRSSTISGNTSNGITVEDFIAIAGSTISGNSGRGVSGGRNAIVSDSEITANMRSAVSAGQLTMANSSVVRNGSGVSAYYDLSIENSTIAGNHGQPVRSIKGTISLNHATVVDNTLRGNTPAAWGPGEVVNSIVANNRTLYGTLRDVDPALSIETSLIGSNTGTDLVEARPGSPDANGNLIGTAENPIDPLLGYVYENGGTTVTAASSHNSPGINGASAGSATDQIGRSRIDAPDMGAFEFDATLHKAPVVVVLDTRSTEGSESLDFEVRATSLPAPGEQVVATLDVQGGTARRNIDYPDFDAVSVTLIPTGSTVASVSVPLTPDDALGEPNRDLGLVVSSITGPNTGSVDGIGTILNDDEFEVRVTSAPAVEGDSGTQRMPVPA